MTEEERYRLLTRAHNALFGIGPLKPIADLLRSDVEINAKSRAMLADLFDPVEQDKPRLAVQWPKDGRPKTPESVCKHNAIIEAGYAYRFMRARGIPAKNAYHWCFKKFDVAASTIRAENSKWNAEQDRNRRVSAAANQLAQERGVDFSAVVDEVIAADIAIHIRPRPLDP